MEGIQPPATASIMPATKAASIKGPIMSAPSSTSPHYQQVAVPKGMVEQLPVRTGRWGVSVGGNSHFSINIRVF